MNKKCFGEKIRESRHEAHLTSEKVSELCECTPISIRQIESGARLPSLPKLVNLCNILQVTPTRLLKSELTFLYDESELSDENKRVSEMVRRIDRLSGVQMELVLATVETMLSQLESINHR